MDEVIYHHQFIHLIFQFLQSHSKWNSKKQTIGYCIHCIEMVNQWKNETYLMTHLYPLVNYCYRINIKSKSQLTVDFIFIKQNYFVIWIQWNIFALSELKTDIHHELSNCWSIWCGQVMKQYNEWFYHISTDDGPPITLNFLKNIKWRVKIVIKSRRMKTLFIVLKNLTINFRS